jgi:hypothetical protein
LGKSVSIALHYLAQVARAGRGVAFPSPWAPYKLSPSPNRSLLYQRLPPSTSCLLSSTDSLLPPTVCLPSILTVSHPLPAVYSPLPTVSHTLYQNDSLSIPTVSHPLTIFLLSLQFVSLNPHSANCIPPFQLSLYSLSTSASLFQLPTHLYSPSFNCLPPSIPTVSLSLPTVSHPLKTVCLLIPTVSLPLSTVCPPPHQLSPTI